MLEAIYNSRKFKMGLLVMLLIVSSSMLILLNPLFLQVLHILVGGLVSTYGIYCGMNVANKWALGKAQGATVESSRQLDTFNDELPQIEFSEED